MVKDMEDEIREALTIQALHMRNEVYFGAGMSQETFEKIYLNNLGDYERDLAKKEGIEINNK